jgi:cytochrome c553
MRLMHITWKHVALTLAVLPFAVLIVTWIGFFNVGASSGHWKITEWFLHFAMRSAVRTYALAVEVPDELPRDAIQPAAGHFARGCAICHGAPGEARSPAALKMLPQPPDLAHTVGEWTDAQLFRIVKHGVRFTGMPAWPTQDRDDEVWAMVAFLRELPSLDRDAYRDLAYGGQSLRDRPAGFEEALADCARCHGNDGMGRSTAMPRIAAQSETYLLESLRAYAKNGRVGGIMALSIAAVEEDEWPALARHYANLPANRPSGRTESRLVGTGRHIVVNGVAGAGVPACAGCHAAGRNPLYPRLNGQSPAYLAQQLRLFRAGKRGGTPYSHLMRNVAKGLTDAQIEALAAYFAAQPAVAATGLAPARSLDEGPGRQRR